MNFFEVKTGKTKDGSEWKSVDFLAETMERYPKKILFALFGKDKVENLLKDVHAGDDVTVSFDVKAREYKGRWYNEVNAWRVFKPQSGGTQQPVQQQSADDSDPFAGDDDGKQPF